MYRRKEQAGLGGCRLVAGIAFILIGVICIVPVLIYGYDLLTLFSVYYPNALPKDPTNRDILLLATFLITSLGMTIIGAKLLRIGG
jgi:hypothetical protein